MDPYQSCPCGSGKNFKWCCQPYFAQVEKARKLHQEGQHESALNAIAQLVAKTPNNAAVLGYQAELQYMNGKVEEADETLGKAFAIDPNYPFGHWLRGMIRKDEGETIGALIQFRKAADLYDPKANDVLADIQAGIFDLEMRLNRPVAARAALERAIHFDPAAEPLRKAFDNLFSPDSRLPESARKAYSFRPGSPERKERWQATLPSTQPVRLGEAQKGFETLTAEDATDAAAWYNLGLVRAWQGEHPKAIEALEKSIEIDSDATKVAEAGALIEVLRCGDGMEERSDYLEHRVFFQLQQPQPVIQLLESWAQNNRLSGAQQDPESGTLSAMVLEETPQFSVSLSAPVAKLAGYMLIVGNMMRLWSPREEGLNKLADEVASKLGGAVAAPMADTGHANFSDIAVEAMLFPTRDAKITDIQDKLRDQAQSFFEETWINRPLKSLGGVSPLDAAGHPNYQKKLRGVVKFMEECFITSSPRVSDGQNVHIVVVYDFSRLRGKLGLGGEAPASAPTSEGPNIEVLSPAELAALNAAELSEEQLGQAFRAALRLDAQDLAGKFARDVIGRPAGQGDRYPFFNHLMQLAQSENKHSEVLALLDQAEAADDQSNEGRRKLDYLARRGRTLAKQGDVEGSYRAFRDLLGREGVELKHYGPAIEAMLGQKNGPKATELAEEALAKARARQDRNSEQYFIELAAAAKKLG